MLGLAPMCDSLFFGGHECVGSDGLDAKEIPSGSAIATLHWARMRDVTGVLPGPAPSIGAFRVLPQGVRQGFSRTDSQRLKAASSAALLQHAMLKEGHARARAR